MQDLIKKYWKLLVFIFLLLLCTTVAIPVLINILFKIPAPHMFFEAEWQAADALSYYGGVLSFLGTSALSALALWQNQKINEANKKNTALLEQMERERNAPNLIIQDCVVLGNASNISFVITNISDNIAQDVTLSNYTFVDISGHTYWSTTDVHLEPYLVSSKPKKIVLSTPGVRGNQTRLTFKIRYVDIFGVRHERNVVGLFNNENSDLNIYIQRSDALSNSKNKECTEEVIKSVPTAQFKRSKFNCYYKK